MNLLILCLHFNKYCHKRFDMVCKHSIWFLFDLFNLYTTIFNNMISFFCVFSSQNSNTINDLKFFRRIIDNMLIFMIYKNFKNFNFFRSSFNHTQYSMKTSFKIQVLYRNDIFLVVLISNFLKVFNYRKGLLKRIT